MILLIKTLDFLCLYDDLDVMITPSLKYIIILFTNVRSVLCINYIEHIFECQ